MRTNVELKEELEKRDKTIARLQQEVNKHKKRPLNKVCSKEVHHITKKLKTDQYVEFDFNVGANDPHNVRIMNRIVEGAMSSTQSSHYSKQDAEIATRRYFSNLKDEHTRERRGTKERHLKCMRRNSRKDTKLKMRLSGLKSKFCKLSPVQKQNAKAIMHMDYMSSDEDEVEEAEDGTVYRSVRILPWESNEARHIKEVLMDTHIQYELGGRDRKRMQKLRRDENCAFSERKCPDNAPAWACIN